MHFNPDIGISSILDARRSAEHLVCWAISLGVTAIELELRELRRRVDERDALVEHAFDTLKGAYRSIVQAELALKRARTA